MRVIVIGMGVQGHKRKAVAGEECVAVVDPVHDDADYKNIQQVPIDSYDAALVCTPDETKLDILNFLLKNAKHVLVEKPLLVADNADLEALKALAQDNNVICYTAYNHRFEPHFIRMKKAIDSNELGEVYSLRMFYGNGTAQLVRESAWRDQGAGVLPDLGSHLLDTALFWLRKPAGNVNIFSANCFENKSFDHVTFGAEGKPLLQMEITLLSWRNHFYADVYAEKGSAHITSLCKWGPSTFIQRDRKLPSGRPDEEIETIEQPDPTWESEYAYFNKLCRDPQLNGYGNIDNDIWINTVLNDLARQAMGETQ